MLRSVPVASQLRKIYNRVVDELSVPLSGSNVKGGGFGDKPVHRGIRHSKTIMKKEMVGDGKGHIEANGTARNNFHTGTKLSFRLDLHQTFLPGIIKGLEDIDP